MSPDSPILPAILIVAAGRGERAGASVEGPKQYRKIGDKAVIAHTIATFSSWPSSYSITVVIHPDDEEFFSKALQQAGPLTVPVDTVHGGATRQASVLAGLRALQDRGATHVMIHDAVRPFFDHALLDRMLTAFENQAKAVLPTMPVTDTLKKADESGRVLQTISRQGLYAAQTPQSFRLKDILDAHEKAASSGEYQFTDDASIAEWAGLAVYMIEGMPDNVKLTLGKDIVMAHERLSLDNLPDVRTGNGYDVHQLEPGDSITLCGVSIPHHQKLKGHSDADVALHALTDALLATCGAGDIGDHFPPSDPQWKGASSHIFVEHAAQIVRAHGGTIMNADISLIAEAPKIGPHRDVMRAKLSEYLQISLERCSVKATTNEKIGFIGRGEGIAAIATATVVYRATKP